MKFLTKIIFCSISFFKVSAWLFYHAVCKIGLRLKQKCPLPFPLNLTAKFQSYKFSFLQKDCAAFLNLREYQNISFSPLYFPLFWHLMTYFILQNFFGYKGEWLKKNHELKKCDEIPDCRDPCEFQHRTLSASKLQPVKMAKCTVRYTLYSYSEFSWSRKFTVRVGRIW